jgi:hypothetical protein
VRVCRLWRARQLDAGDDSPPRVALALSTPIAPAGASIACAFPDTMLGINYESSDEEVETVAATKAEVSYTLRRREPR